MSIMKDMDLIYDLKMWQPDKLESPERHLRKRLSGG